MSKLTVKEYATIHSVSVQSIYKRIKSGSLAVEEINNIKYIIINDEPDYKKELYELKLERDTLKQLLEAKQETIDVLKDKQLLLIDMFNKNQEKPIITEDIEVKKKKKKKKKGKNK